MSLIEFMHYDMYNHVYLSKINKKHKTTEVATATKWEVGTDIQMQR